MVIQMIANTDYYGNKVKTLALLKSMLSHFTALLVGAVFVGACIWYSPAMFLLHKMQHDSEFSNALNKAVIIQCAVAKKTDIE